MPPTRDSGVDQGDPGAIRTYRGGMRRSFRRRPVPDQAPRFSVDTSPHADRLRLATSFASDDETQPTGEERRTYDPTCALDLRHLAIKR